MTNLPISELSPVAALEQAIKASQLLLTKLANYGDFEEEQLEKTDQLSQVRTLLVEQVFASTWPEEAVELNRTKFESLETLNAQLIEQAAKVRYDLHQQRVDNQQGRKAVSAYGTARNQFHR